MPMRMASIEDLFKTLIVTTISQNTTDRNTARAFENLSNKFKITNPYALAKTKQKEIKGSLNVAGLYRREPKTRKSSFTGASAFSRRVF